MVGGSDLSLYYRKAKIKNNKMKEDRFTGTYAKHTSHVDLIRKRRGHSLNWPKRVIAAERRNDFWFLGS